MVQTSAASGASGQIEFVLQTIEEESHDVGIGDTVTISANAGSDDAGLHRKAVSWQAEVVTVPCVEMYNFVVFKQYFHKAPRVSYLSVAKVPLFYHLYLVTTVAGVGHTSRGAVDHWHH